MAWQKGEPQAAPNVYLPQGDGEPTPVYEAYADPAEAHGWQDTHDALEVDTQEMPAAADEGDGPVEPPDRRARLQRRRARLMRRRMIVAAGGVCVIGLGLALGGVFGSGSSDGSRPGGQGKGGDGTQQTSAPAGSADGSPTTGGTSTSAATSHTASPTSSGQDDDSPSATTSAGASKPPATGSSATPTATSTADGGPGNSGDKSDRGKGSTKAPR